MEMGLLPRIHSLPHRITRTKRGKHTFVLYTSTPPTGVDDSNNCSATSLVTRAEFIEVGVTLTAEDGEERHVTGPSSRSEAPRALSAKVKDAFRRRGGHVVGHGRRYTAQTARLVRIRTL